MVRLMFVVVFAAILMTGCATAQKINSVSIGMTKQDVINVLGSPTSTSARGGVEYLHYRLTETFYAVDTPYFVRIINGKVDSYGRLGDFDSTGSLEEGGVIGSNISSSHAVANEKIKRAEDLAGTAAYSIGCTQEKPGQYTYIEEIVDTLDKGLREYLKENPGNAELLKAKSLAAVNNFKELSASEKYTTCNAINDKLKNLSSSSNNLR